MRISRERVKSWLKWVFAGAPACEHEWRPCIVDSFTYGEKKPARICADCKAWEPLTPEQFYAQFGENFYTAARKAAR